MKWYQCNIIKKNGRKDYWCRFIAKHKEAASAKIDLVLGTSLYGSLRKGLYRIVAKRNIKDFEIVEVKTEVLELYDLNNSLGVDSFHKRGLELKGDQE